VSPAGVRKCANLTGKILLNKIEKSMHQYGGGQMQVVARNPKHSCRKTTCIREENGRIWHIH
jgi:hypothetical protein